LRQRRLCFFALRVTLIAVSLRHAELYRASLRQPFEGCTRRFSPAPPRHADCHEVHKTIFSYDDAFRAMPPKIRHLRHYDAVSEATMPMFSCRRQLFTLTAFASHDISCAIFCRRYAPPRCFISFELLLFSPYYDAACRHDGAIKERYDFAAMLRLLFLDAPAMMIRFMPPLPLYAIAMPLFCCAATLCCLRAPAYQRVSYACHAAAMMPCRHYFSRLFSLRYVLAFQHYATPIAPRCR